MDDPTFAAELAAFCRQLQNSIRDRTESNHWRPKPMDDHLAEAMQKLNPGDWLKISPNETKDGRVYWATLRSNHGLPTSCAWIDDKLIDACGGSVSSALEVTIEKLIIIRRREVDAETDLHNPDQTQDNKP